MTRKKHHEPLKFVKHPKLGIMSYKSGWLTRIGNQLDPVAMIKNGDAIMIDYDISKRVSMTEEQREKRAVQHKKRWTNRGRKRQKKCEACKEKKSGVREFKGKDTCDDCLSSTMDDSNYREEFYSTLGAGQIGLNFEGL